MNISINLKKRRLYPLANEREREGGGIREKSRKSKQQKQLSKF